MVGARGHVPLLNSALDLRFRGDDILISRTEGSQSGVLPVNENLPFLFPLPLGVGQGEGKQIGARCNVPLLSRGCGFQETWVKLPSCSFSALSAPRR